MKNIDVIGLDAKAVAAVKRKIAEKVAAPETRSELDATIEREDLVRWPKSDPFIKERERDNAILDEERGDE